jgi:hypothetical protein
VKLASLVSIAILYGTRYPPAPQIPGVIEGPFTFTGSFASQAVADKPFATNAATALFVIDRKLYAAGVNGSASPTGVLLADSIGVDLNPLDNTGAQIMGLLYSWYVVHVPAASQRERAMALNHFARLQTGQSVSTGTGDAATAVRQGDGPFVPQVVPFSGGSWKVNLQNDVFCFRIAQAQVATPGVTLTSTVAFSGRIRGIYITQDAAQDMGILGSNDGCAPTADDIDKVVGARKALGQPFNI